jgi:hypothetical protein
MRDRMIFEHFPNDLRGRPYCILGRMLHADWGVAICPFPEAGHSCNHIVCRWVSIGPNNECVWRTIGMHGSAWRVPGRSRTQNPGRMLHQIRRVRLRRRRDSDNVIAKYALACIPWYVECVEKSGPGMGGDLEQFACLKVACSKNLSSDDTTTAV